MGKTFLCCLFVCFCVAGNISANAPENKILLKVTKSYVKGAREFGVKLEQEYDAKLSPLESKINSYQKKFKNTEYIFYVNENNIFKASLIYQLMLDLQGSYSTTLISLNENIDMLSYYQKGIGRCLQKLRNIQSREHLNCDFQKQIIALESSLQIIKDRKQNLEKYHKRLTELNSLYQERLDTAERLVENKYQNLPFVQETPLYNSFFWKIVFTSSLYVSFENIRHSFSLQSPNNLSEWLILLCSLIFVVLPLSFILKRIILKRISPAFFKANDNRRLISRSIFLTLTGLVILASKLYMSPFGVSVF
ncbi:MAG: hypothetical protein GY750_20210 [Lentisphaerae bacterium]|nr:hypothetical protein [Lentisphaerota bacterium]MCP4103718.1 hypothetical protein [Lentisphaerota bacterium]